MRNLIYFPDIEVKSERWLKFALLYINTLHQIAPIASDANRSVLYQKLMDNSDLISSYRPEKEDHKDSAAIDAIKSIQECLSMPAAYSPIFGVKKVSALWRDKFKMDYEIYADKFNEPFIRFLFELKLTKKGNRGYFVHQHIGHIYMMILAGEICNKNVGQSIITDKMGFFKLENKLVRRYNISDGSFDVDIAQKMINAILMMPGQLDKIPIEAIMTLRESKGFKASMNTFQDALGNFYRNLEGPLNEFDFIEKYKNSLSDVRERILTLGTGVINVSLGTAVLATQHNPSIWDFLKNAWEGVVLLKETSSDFLKSKKAYPTKVRKYITQLQNL